MKFNMKKNRIRIFSLLLALVLVVNSIPMPTFADVDKSMGEMGSAACTICNLEDCDGEHEICDECGQYDFECECEKDVEYYTTTPSDALEVCPNCSQILEECKCDELETSASDTPGEEETNESEESDENTEEQIIWDQVGEVKDICMLGFIDSQYKELAFLTEDGWQNSYMTLETSECPSYFIVSGVYPHKETGEDLLYIIDSFDSVFFDELYGSNYLEPKYFSKLVSAEGLYVTLTGDEITLYTDSAMTDKITVDGSELSGEYIVEEFVYDYTLAPEAWTIRLATGEEWPVDEEYAWILTVNMGGLSINPTVGDVTIGEEVVHNITNLWNSVEDENEIGKIGFIDEDRADLTFVAEHEAEDYIVASASNCPSYFIVEKEYLDEDDFPVFYKVKSYDEAFCEEIEAKYCYLNADVFSEVVNPEGLYVTLKDNEEIILWKDLLNATEVCTVQAGTLSNQYLVCGLEKSTAIGSSEWFVQLEQDSQWPEDADGYVWTEARLLDDFFTEEIKTITATVNGQTVEVAGAALPVGAQLNVSVPEINGEPLQGVFDIKVFDKNGDEWQPIDDDETVTLSIPVEGVEDGEFVDILHHIDYEDAVTQDAFVFSIEDVDQVAYPLLQPAVDAYGDGEHFAIELFHKLEIEDGMATFDTSSFSIYQWNTNTEEYDKVSDENQIVTFFNIAGLIRNAEYYASPGQSFTITTSFGPKNSNPYSLNSGTTVFYNQESDIFENDDGSNEKFDISALGTPRKAYVNVPSTAAVGEKIIIDFNGGNGATATLTVNIVREVTIQYSTNGKDATNMPSPLSYTTVADGDRATFTVSSTKPSAPNCEFLGWNTSPAGDGDPYTGGNVFSPTRDLILYAIWQADQYTVKFDHNNGTNIVTEQVVDYNTSIAVPKDPKRENYTFLGWSATTDGYNHLYQPGEALTVVSDVTMYAVWGVDLTIIVSGGTVKLQKIDETVFTEIAKHTDKYEESVDSSGATVYHIVLVENSYGSANFEFIPSSSGLKLSRYSTGANITFVDQTNKINAVISSAGVTANSTITFSATEKQSYIVSYETNYGTPVPSTTVLEDANSIANLPETTRTGYKFEGWFKDSSLTNGPYTSLTNITSNITLYAKWDVQSYTVTWNVDGSKTAVDYEYGETIILPEEPTKTGYTFDGWWAYTSDGWKEYTSEMTMPANNVEFTAKWAVSVRGSIDNGGMIRYQLGVVDQTYDQGLLSLPAVPVGTGAEMTLTFTPAEGYEITEVTTLVGNVEQEVIFDEGSYIYTVPAEGIAASVDISVTTSKITYTVSYNANAGFDAPEEQTKFYGENLTLSSTEPKREGHEFLGWSTNSESTEVEYQPGKIYTANESLALYAVWKIKNFKVTFVDDDGSTILKAAKEYPYGTLAEDIEKPDDPTKSTTAQYRYEFAGWSPAIANVTADATYKATYSKTPNKYTITYLGGGSLPSGKTNPDTYTCEDEDFTLNNPEKTGYTFTGWTSTSLTEPTLSVTIKKGTTGALEYTATWLENTVAISYVAGENGKVKAETNGTLENIISEEVAVWNGTALGAIAVPDLGYKFIGWYDKNDACVSLDESWIPQQKLNSMWEEAIYTAKFERAFADLTISITGHDADQSFIFAVSGTPEDSSYGSISLNVVLAGKNSITIKDLPVGTYTVYEDYNTNNAYDKLKWAWRWMKNGPKEVTLTDETKSVTFNYGNIFNNFWLNGYDYGKYPKGGNR